MIQTEYRRYLKIGDRHYEFGYMMHCPNQNCRAIESWYGYGVKGEEVSAAYKCHVHGLFNKKVV